MSQVIFSFTLDTETNKAAYAGNVSIGTALQLLQQVFVAEMAKKGDRRNKKRNIKQGGP